MKANTTLPSLHIPGPVQPIRTLPRILGVVLLSLSLATFTVAQENRTALVIGCDYRGTGLQLPSPLQDARALGARLGQVGFAGSHVTLLLNPTRKQMLEAIEAFGAALSTRGGVGLFYFSGHGAQHDGENFLIPAQSTIGYREDLPGEAVSAQRVVTRMEAAGNRVSLLFLDACRNNPLPSSRSKTALVKGLGGMNAANGMLIGFATARNAVANDTGTGSLYTNALVRQITTPGLSVTDMLTRVNSEVRKASGETQIPMMEVGLSDVFTFVPGGTPNAAIVDPPPRPPRPTVVHTQSQVFAGGPYHAFNDYSQHLVLRKVQELLAVENLYAGHADGKMGTNTQRAIYSWQENRELPVTGLLDQATLESMSLTGMNETEAPPPPVAAGKRGSRGERASSHRESYRPELRREEERGRSSSSKDKLFEALINRGLPSGPRPSFPFGR
jgi:Caspase domain/Putative peptidoglycan binding domain